MAWDRDYFHDIFPRQDEPFRKALDRSLAPRGPAVLLQVVRDLGVGPDSAVVDVGCGEGGDAFRLATHFGLRVLGIDPAQRRLDVAREARRTQPEQIASRVSFERGSAGRIPVPDGAVDLVWCSDVLDEVEDVAAAYAEFARVLRPGGLVVCHQVVATDLLAAAEAAWLFGVLGVVPDSTDPLLLGDAISASGLRVVETIDLAGEWGEWSEEESGRASRALVHVARLRREPERYRTEFGEAAYDVMLAECLWQVYRMLGKLAGRIDVLWRP